MEELKYIKVNIRLSFQTILKHLDAETLFLHHNHLNTQPTGVFMDTEGPTGPVGGGGSFPVCHSGEK